MFFVDLVSCVWTNDPYESAKQIILLFICLMLCATTVARLGPEQSLKIIFEGLFAVCFASLLLVIFFPRSSIHNASDVLQNVHAGRWRGVFEHKNELGQAAALLSIVSITAGSIIAYSKKFRIVAIGLSLVLLFNAESASSNVSVAFAIIAYVFLSFNKFARVILGVAMVLLLFAVQLAGINVTATLAGLAGRDGSLTGRTEVWAYTLNRISQFWPFGLGYGNTNAFRTELQNNLGEAIVNSHNAFFEIALTTGLLGVVFLTVIIAQVSNWTLAFEARRDELGKASLILVLNWLFIGLTEDWTIQPNNVIFVSGIISFFILFSNQRRSAQTKAEVQTT